MKKLFILFIAVAGFGVSSYAQNSATATGVSAGATIFAPIAITNPVALNFGAAKADGAATKTVILATSGTRTGTATTATIGTAASAARFDVTGTANATYSITVPSDGTVTLTGPGTDMPVSSFVSALSAGGANVGTGTLSSGGAQSVYVGATLTIGIAQTSGVYSGTYDVTVAYN